MGAWGYGIRQDDFVLDVIGCFEDLLKAGQSVRDATTAVKARFAAAIGDDDDGRDLLARARRRAMDLR
jgi:hypothetical protein